MSGEPSDVPKVTTDILAKRSKEGFELFDELARLVLSTWDVINTAVDEEWGGPSTDNKLDHILSDFIMNSKENWDAGNELTTDVIDYYLLECLEDDFNIEFDDENVVTEVSLIVRELYLLCMGGNFVQAKEIAEKASQLKVESESEDDTPKVRERIVDEDGWEVVVDKRMNTNDIYVEKTHSDEEDKDETMN